MFFVHRSRVWAMVVLIINTMKGTRALNHGRDATIGEYPFIVRIVVAEEVVAVEDDLNEDNEEIIDITSSTSPTVSESPTTPPISARQAQLATTKSPSPKSPSKQRVKKSPPNNPWFGSHTKKNKNTSLVDGMSSGLRNNPIKDVHMTDLGRIAAGVLINDVRVLTTCDSVGFFTGQQVNLYDVSRVSIMGGSVKKSGEGGQFRSPSNSSVHPYCYSLVSGIVLFNYGLYELKTPFIMSWVLKPAKNVFVKSREMALALRRKTHEGLDTNCETAGWGYPRKEFEGKGMPDHFEAASKVLQAINTSVIQYTDCNEKTCAKLGECLLAIWEYGFVCAEAKSGGPCMNDKGAPLVCEHQVYGIHTNQFKCEDEGVPRHFLRLDLALDYIYDIKNSSELCANCHFVIAACLSLLFSRLTTSNLTWRRLQLAPSFQHYNTHS